MPKKLQRVFRDRHLTPDEVAADKDLRRKIEAEFPPNIVTNAIQVDSLSELLRRSIRESGRPLDEIANNTGVSLNVINGFLSGQRDIHMTAADRLARALGLEVTTE